MSRRVRVNVFKDKASEWRWNMVTPNGNKIACAGEGYKRRIDCLTSLCLVLDLAPEDVQYRVHGIKCFLPKHLRALRLKIDQLKAPPPTEEPVDLGDIIEADDQFRLAE